MPAYGTPQIGSNTLGLGFNLTGLQPGGQPVTLISAADASATGFKSVAIARGYRGGSGDQGITFYQRGCPNGTITQIQASDTDVDADYLQVGLITGNGFYVDEGNSAFYRAFEQTFEGGDVPVVTASRS